MTADSRNGEQWTAQLEADGSGAWEVTFPAPKDFPGTGIIAYGLTEKAAHLIAAAPAMLKVLEDVLVGVTWSYAEPGHVSGLKTMVEHVVALAEGRA